MFLSCGLRVRSKLTRRASLERRIGQQGIGRLHELIAQAMHRLHWHKKLLNAYRFHRESAFRQNDGFLQLLSDLPHDAVVVLFDWKENLSLPLANVQTGDMFWANSRKEVSVLGFAVWQYKDKVLQKTRVAYISDILDHTALISDLLIRKAISM